MNFLKIIKIGKLLLLYVIYSICSIFILLTIYALHDEHYSKKAIIGKRNISNSSKIYNGMKIEDVVRLMGIPDEIEYRKNEVAYKYLTNNNSFPFGNILFNQLNEVVKFDFPSFDY